MAATAGSSMTVLRPKGSKGTEEKQTNVTLIHLLIMQVRHVARRSLRLRQGPVFWLLPLLEEQATLVWLLGVRRQW
jgi:hypothetical protein